MENIFRRKTKHEDISNMYLIEFWSQFVSRNRSLSFKEMELRLVCTRKGSTTTGTFICVIRLMMGKDIRFFLIWNSFGNYFCKKNKTWGHPKYVFYEILITIGIRKCIFVIRRNRIVPTMYQKGFCGHLVLLYALYD